ncbi:MAG: response regulator [Verrucomicrobia bacterium]|jgi:DNA-binding NarL/FixJ family response regulator|nr:response regulator [Verrucomicrobiota bacterium]
MEDAITAIVVDDSTAVRRILIKLLTEAGVTLQGEAGTAEAAVDLCKENTPDLIFLDVMMPGISGIDVIPALHELSPMAKIIMLTSVSERDTVLKAHEAGAHNYLLKPFDVNNLKRQIQKLCTQIEEGKP